MYAEHFAVAVSVNTGGQKYGAFDHPAAFAHFDRQCVAGQVGVPAGIEWAVFEVCDHLVEFFRHARYLGFRHVGNPKCCHQVIHPTGGNPFEVAGRDHSR